MKKHTIPEYIRVISIICCTYTLLLCGLGVLDDLLNLHLSFLRGLFLTCMAATGVMGCLFFLTHDLPIQAKKQE